MTPYDPTKCGIIKSKIELGSEVLNFLESVANLDNWEEPRYSKWIAKRHCRLWAKEILDNLNKEEEKPS